MLKLKQKGIFVCTLMAALLLLLVSASAASARDVDVTSPPALAESGQAPADTPNLIMTLDGNVTAPDNQSDQPNLYQAQDTPPTVDDDNSTMVIAQNEDTGGAEQNNLIATQASHDLSVLIAGCASLLVAVAAVGAFALYRRRTHNQMKT
jgi:hypothetical protein